MIRRFLMLTLNEVRMLKIKNIETGYSKKQVLFGLTMNVHKGDIVALIGPNGAGKSTVLKSVCGILKVWNGEIHFNDDVINGSNPIENVARGIIYAPQGNRVFANLTVMENLKIGGFRYSLDVLNVKIDQIFQVFPILKKRLNIKAGNLSGGEQQMLALARALLPKPKLLMLDEPSLGLSPNLVKDIFNKVLKINNDFGVSFLIVEQKVREVLEISNKFYSLKQGKVFFEGLPSILINDTKAIKKLFL